MSREVELKCPWLAAEELTAKVLRWLVAEQDRIEIDQDIMVMELDGEEFIMPSPMDGVLRSILAQPGDWIEPDQGLAIVELE
jgi:biotin carboxyl carrier protein